MDGEEQNRTTDSLWRLVDDARPEPLVVEELRFRGAHGGYLRLADPVRPVRTIALAPELHALVVHDELIARASHEIEIPFHFAIGVEVTGPQNGTVPLGRFMLRWRSPEPWDCSVEPSWVSPAYGVKYESRRIVFRRTGAVAPLSVVLAPTDADEEQLWAWAGEITT